MSEWFVRFSLRQRLEHFTVMVTFTILAVTGLPQKFFEYEVSRWLLSAMGGVDGARFLHRIAGWTFVVLAIVHLGGVMWQVVAGRARFTIVPHRQDFLDAIATLRYYLGTAPNMARFDRYDYRQKFEYWGLVFGAIIMIVTGVILFWPVYVARFLPGEVIPAAKVAHSNEGLMAFLVVVIWHVYNAHFNPDVFPFDTSIFTGRISRERMHHEHPLELERVEARAASVDGDRRH
jgi:cytochrome b subunit of formate dehydrogenase